MTMLDTLNDTKRKEFNDNDWHVDGLPQIIFPVRFVNATGFGLGPSLFASLCIFIIERVLVLPALKQSLDQMKQAEINGQTPSILCNGTARHDMKERLIKYKINILNCEALTCVGKIMNYLAAVKCLKNHKGLLILGEQAKNEQVITPIFIASLPRTGSTVLHRVMALDRSRWRSFDFCDQMLPLSPSPIPRNDPQERTRLATLAEKLMKGMDFLYPGWNACLASVHALEVDQANEDHVWYNSALGHPFVGTLMLLHREERRQADQNNGISPLNSIECAQYRYAWLHMILRIYQKADNTNKNIPWLMKDPRHANFLPQLLQQFPDAKLIFTHRPPVALFPSVTKLMICNTCTFHIPGAPGTTSKEWGIEILKRTKHLCDTLVAFTKEQAGTDLGCSMYSSTKPNKSQRRIDITFQDFVKDIPAIIQTIYTQLFPNEPGPTPQMMQEFQNYISKNRSKSSQRYKLEDFHLTKDDLNFPEYNQLFS